MNKPLVMYHADCADGFGAAFAAWLKFGDEAEYLPMQYGQDPAEHIPEVEGREVHILDFSFERAVMNGLFANAKRVVWLDHHKTAFEMWCPKWFTYEDAGSYFKDDNSGHRIELDNTRSGALIAWDYFHPDTEVPMLLKHIDDYDRWQFKLEGTKAFNKALWSYTPWNFEQWNDWLIEEQSTGLDPTWMVEEGEAILRAHSQNVQSVVKHAAMKCRLEFNEQILPSDDQPTPIRFYEFREGLAANCPPHLHSDVGHELANKSGTFALLWNMQDDGRIKCGLRSVKGYDVSAIAKAFGGGGHKNSAGFYTDIETLMGWLK